MVAWLLHSSRQTGQHSPPKDVFLCCSGAPGVTHYLSSLNERRPGAEYPKFQMLKLGLLLRSFACTLQVKINGFSEQDQENLYHLAHDKSGKGRQGLGIASRPKKVCHLNLPYLFTCLYLP